MGESAVSKRSCSQCDHEKPLEDFGADRRQSDGLSLVCKGCINSGVRSRRRQRDNAGWFDHGPSREDIERVESEADERVADAFDALRANRDATGGEA